MEKNGFLMYNKVLLHARQDTSDTHKQAQNTFGLIGVVLHVFKKTDILNSFARLQRGWGGGGTQTTQFVDNTGQNEKKKYIKSQIYGHLEHFFNSTCSIP